MILSGINVAHDSPGIYFFVSSHIDGRKEFYVNT